MQELETVFTADDFARRFRLELGRAVDEARKQKRPRLALLQHLSQHDDVVSIEEQAETIKVLVRAPSIVSPIEFHVFNGLLD